jgi:hypothetical protein
MNLHRRLRQTGEAYQPSSIVNCKLLLKSILKLERFKNNSLKPVAKPLIKKKI